MSTKQKKATFRDIRYQFLRPFAFLSVKGPSLHVYRTTLPLVATVLVCILFCVLPAGLDLAGDKSVSDYMATFFSALPGFFIAALAAVVAFDGGDLDRDIPDVSVAVKVYGDTDSVSVTMRVFLCYLFAYLTVLSFIGFFICVGGALLAPSVTKGLGHVANPDAAWWIKRVAELAFLGVTTFVSASVVFCTGQGLYFLAERVHQNLIPPEAE